MANEVFVVKNVTGSDVEIKVFGIIIPSGVTYDLGNYTEAVNSSEVVNYLNTGTLVRYMNGNAMPSGTTSTNLITTGVLISGTTASTSPTTGALIVSGGTGIQGNLYVAGTSYISYAHITTGEVFGAFGIGASLFTQCQIVTGTTTLTGATWLVICSGATPFTLTMCRALDFINIQYIIKNIGAKVIVDGYGSETIDGNQTIVLNKYDSITLYTITGLGGWVII